MAETITQITQPPEFIEAAAKPYITELQQAVGDFKGADLSKVYDPQFVAGQDPLQTAAIGVATGAQGLGSYAPFLQTAATQAGQAGQAETTVFGSSVVATIMRLKRGGAREFTLMNLDPSSVLNHSSGSSGSLKQVSTVGHFVRGLSVLSRLRNTLARVDNMSHALLWTSSDASMTEYCELTRVELTRLNAQFELKRGALHSLDHDGLKISDSPAPHVKGIKASFITTLNHFFQDLFGLTLFFVPRCSSLFLVVPHCSSLFLIVPHCSHLQHI